MSGSKHGEFGLKLGRTLDVPLFSPIDNIHTIAIFMAFLKI